MKAHHLIPALQVIESGLFPNRVARRGTAVELTEPAAEGAPGSGTTFITPSLKQLMARRAGAAQPLADRTASDEASQDLVVGQIRWITSADAQTIDWPVALLVASLGNRLAQGWIVASESLYASRDDWLLQDSDLEKPPDPRCTMVQLWNPVEVSQDGLGGSAGTLTSMAFSQLLAVAARLEASPADLQATAVQPGRFGLHEFNSADDPRGRVAYVCGTSLGNPESGDPRLYYRYLYLLFAQQLQRQRALAAAPAAMKHGHPASGHRQLMAGKKAAEAANTPFWRLPETWRGVGIAAALIFAVVLPLRLWQQDTASVERGVEPGPAPASNFGQPARFTVVDIHFSADTPIGSVAALMGQIGGRIISGPTETGAWRVGIDDAHIDTARALLASSRWVVTFDKAKQ